MTEKRKLWFMRETDKAFQYSKTPPDRERDQIWIPKSIVEHRTKIGNEHIVTLPSWFCENENL